MMKRLLNRTFRPGAWALLLLLLPAGPAGAGPPGRDEAHAGPSEREGEARLPGGMETLGLAHRGMVQLQLDRSWRDYDKVPESFDRWAKEDPEKHFHLDSPALLELVRAVLDRNPSLLEAEAGWRSALKKARVVSALPDPELTVTAFVENVETRVGPQEAVLSFMQRLPWFGKLSAAGQAAMEEALESAWMWRSLQRQTVLEVKRGFYEIAYLVEALHVTDQDIATLGRVEAVALARYGTGKGLQQDVIKVQSEITRLNERRIVLARQREIAHRNLARLAGSPLADVDVSAVEGDEPVPDVRLDALCAEMIANREELQAGLHAVRARQQETRLARKQAWPDLRLGFNYIVVGDRRDPAGIQMPPPDNGRDAVGVMAGINLPVWIPKLRAGVDAARWEEVKARAVYAGEEDRILFELQDAYISLESLKEQIDLYRNALIPQAGQALKSSEAAYEAGRATFLDLLDSERFLLNVRYGYARVKADYRIALARMERALGRRFPDASEGRGREDRKDGP